MPVNFQQALQQIREMGKQALQQEQFLQELRDTAMGLLGRYAEELDTLEQLVERAAAENPALRCAAPTHEILDQALPLPQISGPYTLLAADGSQINPDRHARVEFGAINVGAIRMTPGQTAQPPKELVQSQILFHDDLFTASGNPLTDDLVALKRDLAEREALVRLARSEPPPTVALTDGPLELFREPRNLPEFEQQLEDYQKVLEELADLGAAAGGYVDKPRGDLVVRLLELVLLGQRGILNKSGEERPLRGVYDINLFERILKPGERSAVFRIHSGSAKSFKGRLALHFFYLNVGREGHPDLSRVEIPRWVAETPAQLDLLHACLLGQSRHLGSDPYPYILHRAHEIAVVSFDEHRQLENMIVAELYRQGAPVGEQSNKQTAKDTHYSRHTRSR